MTDPLRTSPTAKIPGAVVSHKNGHGPLRALRQPRDPALADLDDREATAELGEPTAKDRPLTEF